MIKFKKSSRFGVVLMLAAITLVFLIYKNILYLNNPLVIAIAVTACMGISLIDVETKDKRGM